MRQQLKAIDNAHGGGAALPMTAWYLQREVIPLLNECPAGSPGAARLTEVAAQFHHDTGWAAYDAGQQDLASGHFSTALRLSHTAGNRLLSARVLAAMSHQAIHLGHLRQAVEFAEAAWAIIRHAAPRPVAMVAAMRACAHAAAGDTRQAQQALSTAADALTLPGSGEPEPDWLDFDGGGYWGHAARAYRDLGQPGKAEPCATRSVGLCLAGHSRTRAQRTTIQATAYLRLGEVDAAAAAAEQVVHQAWQLHSGHVFSEVAQLASAIAPYRTPAAADFLDQALLSAAAHRHGVARVEAVAGAVVALDHCKRRRPRCSQPWCNRKPALPPRFARSRIPCRRRGSQQ